MRIRIASTSGTSQARSVRLSSVVGTLVRIDDDTLTLTVDGTQQPLGVNRGSIAKLEVSAGRRSRAKNALIGAGIGVVGAAAVLLLRFGSDSLDDGAVFAESTAIVATATVPMCALIGLALPTPERWKEVPAERLRASVPGHGAGVALAVSLKVSF